MMTLSVTPQQMRDRLLQAIDSQSNICNRVVLLEVIASLENYPITKEALEETCLGKLIDDVQQKTEDEDFAKRAQKLIQNWQKLIEAGSTVAASIPASINVNSHPCKIDTPPLEIFLSGSEMDEIKVRSDVLDAYSTKPEEELSSCKAEQGHISKHLADKSTKRISYNFGSPPPSNGIAGSPDILPDREIVPSQDDSCIDHLNIAKMNTIPVEVVTHDPSPLRVVSGVVAVMHQQVRMDDGDKNGYFQADSPCGLTTVPSITEQDTMINNSTWILHKETSVCAPELPFHCPLQDTPPSQPRYMPHLHTPKSERVEDVSDNIKGTAITENKRRKYRSRENSKLHGQKDCTSKAARLKKRTGKIKPVVHKQSSQIEEDHTADPSESRQKDKNTDPNTDPGDSRNPFHQTNWKELSTNEMIQFYLNLQSNVLNSSGVQAPNAHFFMSQYLQKEEQQVKASKKTYVRQTDNTSGNVPGVSREVMSEDLNKIRTQHWPGVNGCYDTKGTWYDWTECVSVNPHGDEGKLNILPYVCLD